MLFHVCLEWAGSPPYHVMACPACVDTLQECAAVRTKILRMAVTPWTAVDDVGCDLCEKGDHALD